MRVYIDGENCRKSLSRALLRAGVIQDSREMVEYKLRELLQDVLEAEEMSIDYYASKIRLPQHYEPTEDMQAHLNVIKEYNRKWIPCLQKQGILYRKAGYLRPRSTKPCRTCNTKHETLQEKGVDVRLASDLLEDVFRANHNKVVIVSSDGDLLPAIEKIVAHENQTEIIYVCFGGFVNPALSGKATETVSISMDKIRKYYVEAVQPKLPLD